MRIISEQDINRLVKKVLSEQTSIKIMGTEVKIDVNYDSKIYVGEYSYWVTARTCSVLDNEDCNSFEILKQTSCISIWTFPWVV